MPGKQGERRTRTCPDCRGQMVRRSRNAAGELEETRCQRCDGTGVIRGT